MKFAKLILMICLFPVTINAAPKPKVGESIATLDVSIQSLISSNDSLNTNTLSLTQTMQLIGVNTLTLDSSVKALNTSVNTLNTSSTTLNSSTTSLNQTNGSLNNSVQNLEQKIVSLQGSVNALKLSIDNLALSSGGNGGDSSNEVNINYPSVENLIYITNCSIPTVLASAPSNYRCDSYNSTMQLYKPGNLYAYPSSDVIFEVPADKSFVMTGFNVIIFQNSIPNSTSSLVLLEKNSTNTNRLKKQLTYNNPNGIQTALSYSQAQGGIIFSPGSKIIISLSNTGTSSSSIPFQFEMNGYLSN